MTQQEMEAKIAALEQENTELKAKKDKKLYLKVSEKGAITICNLRRFGVTLYQEEMVAVLGMADEIHAFIKANTDKLSKKEDK